MRNDRGRDAVSRQTDECLDYTRLASLMEDGWTLHWLPRAEVVHYGEASSQQIAETMYVQLYRSEVQFYRKTGGEARAKLYKRLVTVAYIPRLIVTSIAQHLRPKLAAQVRTFRHLLVDLPTM